MTEKKIQESLKRIVDDAPIDLLGKIQNTPVAKMIAHDEITRQRTSKSLMERLLPLAAAAVLVLILGTWQFQYRTVDSEIYLDINPSIAMTTNRKNQVIHMEAKNDEGRALLERLSYKGMDYLAVTGELLDEMILTGYVGEAKELILLSVYNKDMDKEARKLLAMDTYIHDYLRDRGIDPLVFTQHIEKTQTLADYAAEYGISISKMTFIRNLMILHPDLLVEELVPLSLRELVLLSRELGIDLKGIIESQDWEKVPEKVVPKEEEDIESPEDPEEDSTPKPNDEGPEDEPSPEGSTPGRIRLTMAEARAIALTRVPGTIVEEDADEDGYEFEIHRGNMKYDVEVHAYSGAILDVDVEELEEDDDEVQEGNTPGSVRLTVAEARVIALTRVPGTIMEEDADEDGYEFEIHQGNKKYDIEVHAYTGAIMDIDVEDLDDDEDVDDDEDDDDDDEED